MVLLITVASVLVIRPESYEAVPPPTVINPTAEDELLAHTVLDQLPVKGRAPNTGYRRALFGDGWQSVEGCDMRNIILARDMADEIVDEN